MRALIDSLSSVQPGTAGLGQDTKQGNSVAIVESVRVMTAMTKYALTHESPDADHVQGVPVDVRGAVDWELDPSTESGPTSWSPGLPPRLMLMRAFLLDSAGAAKDDDSIPGQPQEPARIRSSPSYRT